MELWLKAHELEHVLRIPQVAMMSKLIKQHLQTNRDHLEWGNVLWKFSPADVQLKAA